MTLFLSHQDTSFADSLFRVLDLRLPCRFRHATVVELSVWIRIVRFTTRGANVSSALRTASSSRALMCLAFYLLVQVPDMVSLSIMAP